MKLRFGSIHYINVDLTKKSALIKFKVIESAEKAASSDEPVLDNPKIKIVYTVIEPNQQELDSSPAKRESSQD